MNPFVAEPLIPASFPPRPGESIRSYVNALAHANGYTNGGRFQAALGLRYGFGPLAGDEQWGILERATGVARDRLAVMRRIALSGKGDTRQLSLLGSPVNLSYIDKAVWKVCPRCLDEDGYGREIWSLSHAVACPRHRILLVHTCHECGRPLRSWRWVLPKGCVCGGDLTAAPRVRAGAGVVAAAAAMAVAAGAEPAVGCPGGLVRLAFPAPFNDLALGELLDCLHLFGTIALARTTREAAKPRRRDGTVAPLLLKRREILKADAAERAELLAAAASLAQGWPDALWRALDEARGRLSDREHRDPMGRELGPIYNALLNPPLPGKDGRPLAFLWEAARAYRADRYGFRRKAKITSTDPVANRLARHLSTAQLAASHGVTPLYAQKIYRLVLAGLEPDLVAAPDRFLVAEFQRRFKAAFETLRTTLGSHAARASLLGEGTTMRLREWCAPDLLTVAPGTRGMSRGTRFDAQRVRSLLDRLRRNARMVESLDGLVRLSSRKVMQRLTSPTYSKAALLRDMLAGRFPYRAAVAEPKFADFHVDFDEAARFVDRNVAMLRILQAGWISRREVDDLLGAAFGADFEFTRAASRHVRQTAGVPWTKHNKVVLFQRRAVLAWVDEHVAPPGRSVGAALAVGSLAVTSETRRFNVKAYRSGRGRRLRHHPLPSEAEGTGGRLPAIALSDVERAELRAWADRRSSAGGGRRLAARAGIVLACAEGLRNWQVAARLGLSGQTVGRWRRSFLYRRLDGLRDAPRQGGLAAAGDT